MSLNQGIRHKKEHRKQYRGIKAFDPTCRNHGSDYWARRNRLHKFEKSKPIEEEYWEDEENVYEEITIDEAIEHCKLIADSKYCEAEISPSEREQKQCIGCAKEHEQLEKWLLKYKRLNKLMTPEKVIKVQAYTCCPNCHHKLSYYEVNCKHCPNCGKAIKWED